MTEDNDLKSILIEISQQLNDIKTLLSEHLPALSENSKKLVKRSAMKPRI